MAIIRPGFERAASALSAGRLRFRSVLPTRPRFLRELVIVPLEDGVIVHGAEHLHVFKGKATGGLLPALVTLMDGSRTLKQLESAFPGASPEQVRSVLSLLFAWGLVEDGAAERAAVTIPEGEAFAFFRRYATVTGVNPSARQAYERLQASEVLLFDPNETSHKIEALKPLLEKTGIGRVARVNRQSLNAWRPGAAISTTQSLIVSLSFAGDDCERLADLDDWCSKNQVPWLRTVRDEAGGYADLGPLFRPKESPCYRCFHAVHSRPSAALTTQQLHPADIQFWTSMVATEIVYLLSRIGPLATGRDFRCYDLKDWSAQQLRCPRIPGCSRCRPVSHRAIGIPQVPNHRSLLDTPVVFEDYLGLPSRAFSGEREQPEHIRLSLALTRQMKQLMNCSQHALNRQVPPLASGILDVLRADGASSDQSLTVDDLAAVLMLTAGVRDSQAKRPTVKRWAATGGNLGSVELYVVVRNVHGLAPGFYFYQPQEHTLACFRSRGGALKIEDFMRRVIPGGPRDLPDVLALFTAAFHRVARKYGPFAYRLIQLDAGTALSQLHLVARGLNIASRTLDRWADDLIEQQLNLEPLEEQATAVVALSRGESTPASEPNGVPDHSCIRSGQPVSRKPAEDFCGLSLREILTLLYQESRIKEDELGLGEFVVPSYLLDGGFDRASTLSLPPPAHGGRSLDEVLSTRTSIRHYAPKSVTVEQLSTMLHCAHHSDLKWPEEHHLGQSLSFLTLAWRVEGLNRGVYAYDPQNHALSFVRHAPTPQETVELFLQSEFAAAPMVVWIVGNLAAACALHGAFGHRKLLLRAGAAGHRLWMAAAGMGLAGTVTAGVITGAAREQLGLDGYQRASLLAVPIGYAARYFRWPSLPARQGRNRAAQVQGEESIPSDRAT